MDEKLAQTAADTAIPHDLFQAVRKKAMDEYAEIGRIMCPYFGEVVHFNSKGLDHVRLMKHGQARRQNDQFVRLKFLKLVPHIIKTTTTLQGFSSMQKEVRIKQGNRWVRVPTTSYYYEFIYVHKERARVKVIVRKDGAGEKYFYSIIPFWKMGRHRQRIMGSRSAETD